MRNLSRWKLPLDSTRSTVRVAASVCRARPDVAIFFRLAISFDLISGDRPSNGVDIAYLHYLPFCMMFTSNDKLHAKTVPLFLRPNQRFVLGADLKADLKQLDEYFSAQPQEVLDRGVMHFEPPDDETYLMARLWKQFLPGWRPGRGPKDVRMSPKREKELVAELKGLIETPASPRDPSKDPNDADFIALQRMVSVKIGKWRILAEDVAKSALAAQAQNKAESAAAKDEPSIVLGTERI